MGLHFLFFFSSNVLNILDVELQVCQTSGLNRQRYFCHQRSHHVPRRQALFDVQHDHRENRVLSGSHCSELVLVFTWRFGTGRLWSSNLALQRATALQIPPGTVEALRSPRAVLQSRFQALNQTQTLLERHDSCFPACAHLRRARCLNER